MKWKLVVVVAAAASLACGPGIDGGTPPNEPENHKPVDSTAPTRSAQTPAAGATGVLTSSPVTVTFSEPMNTTATGAAFRIVEPTGITGQVSWNDAKTVLTFTPQLRFPYHSDIRWEVSTEARDAAGNRLASSLSGEFSTRDATTIATGAVSPVSGSAGNSVTAPIQVSFSEPASAITEIHFRIDSPAGLTGATSWVGDTAVFTPSQPWPTGQVIRWSVEVTASIDGASVGSTYSGTFTAGAADQSSPTVSGPTPVTYGLPQRFSLTLDFSEPMDQPSVAPALRVFTSTEAATALVQGTLAWNAEGTSLVFTSNVDAPYGAYISWSVSHEARDLAGNALIPGTGTHVARIVRTDFRTLSAKVDLEGTVYLDATSSNGSVQQGGRLVVGDVGASSSVDSRARAFLTFDLSYLDPEAIRITRADLTVWVASVTAYPYVNLGQLSWNAVNYGTSLTPSAYSAQSYASGLLSARDDRVPSVDVASAVAPIWDAHPGVGSLFQLRLQFDGPVSSSPNSIEIWPSGGQDGLPPTLSLQYEIP